MESGGRFNFKFGFKIEFLKNATYFAKRLQAKQWLISCCIGLAYPEMLALLIFPERKDSVVADSSAIFA